MVLRVIIKVVFMNINKSIIESLCEKYSDCRIEEIYENNEFMDNYVCITCDVDVIEEKEINGIILTDCKCQIYELINELNKYHNIDNMYSEMFEDNDDEWFEYLTFEWIL